MQSLNRKLFWLAFWVVGFAVLMTGFLLFFKYQNVFTSLQRDRVQVVAREIDDITEKNLSLGQDFWEIDTLQDVVQRRQSADGLLIGIDVAGQDGKIAYASDLSRLGSQLPADWISNFSRQSRNNIFAPSKDFALVASTIQNSFGQVAGYAVIRYHRAPEHEAMSRFLNRLLLVAALVFGVVVALLFAMLNRVEARLQRALSGAEESFRSGVLVGRHALSGDLQRCAEHAMSAESTLSNLGQRLKASV